MGDACVGLFFAVLLLAILAGCWQLVKVVSQSFFGSSTTEAASVVTKHCVGCGRSLAGWMIQCPGCRLPRNSALARQFQDVFQVLRQLRGLQDQGLIDEAVVNQVQDALVARKRALLAELAPAREE